MLLLTRIYNMPFNEVCMFIVSLEKSDKGNDWWHATLQPSCIQTSFFPTDANFQPKRSRTLCSSAVHLQQLNFCALLEPHGSRHQRNAKSRSCELPFGFIIYFKLFYLNASEKTFLNLFPPCLLLAGSCCVAVLL